MQANRHANAHARQQSARMHARKRRRARLRGPTNRLSPAVRTSPSPPRARSCLPRRTTSQPTMVRPRGFAGTRGRGGAWTDRAQQASCRQAPRPPPPPPPPPGRGLRQQPHRRRASGTPRPRLSGYASAAAWRSRPAACRCPGTWSIWRNRSGNVRIPWGRAEGSPPPSCGRWSTRLRRRRPWAPGGSCQPDELRRRRPAWPGAPRTSTAGSGGSGTARKPSPLARARGRPPWSCRCCP
mmetsp:Transcript_44004/g.136946  ORF Transcript_44004/g.136946 Transcript_44004/m.136946 type:complete len:239 (-) Transcript_44004:930-1646(-)